MCGLNIYLHVHWDKIITKNQPKLAPRLHQDEPKIKSNPTRQAYTTSSKIKKQIRMYQSKINSSELTNNSTTQSQLFFPTKQTSVADNSNTIHTQTMIHAIDSRI